MTSLAKYRTLRGTNILRLVRGILEEYLWPEFLTSATVYVTILSNDQVMSNVESVNNLDSFTIIPAGLSNERAWHLNICMNKNIREKCDEDARDVTCPKPLTQITESKDMLVRVTITNPIQRKGRRKHEEYFMIYR